MKPEYATRLRRLLRTPNSIRSLWIQLGRPWLRWRGYHPELETDALQTLFERGASQSPELMQNGWKEFEHNLRALERNYIVHQQNSAQQLGWLERSYALLVAAERCLKVQTAPESDRTARWIERRRLQALQRRALPPLQTALGSSHATQKRVASIDALLDAADAENDFLGRRRGLLEGARELLLMASESVVDNSGVQARLQHVTQQLGELSRLETDGVKMDVALCHQLRSAITARSPVRLGVLLSAVEHTSHTQLNERATTLEGLASRALASLWGEHDRSSPIHRQRSVALSGERALQAEVGSAITRGYESAASGWQERAERAQLTDAARREVERYLSASASTDLVHAAMYVDGCVDVGGVLSPKRIYDVQTLVREVAFPTQKLTLHSADGVDDLPNAVITDPRSMLLDLATGKLLSRRFLLPERRAIGRNVMASEVRVFLLDGSGSMLGPRARLRDAILVAELSTLIARLNQAGRWLTPTLYYRYFNEELGPIHPITTSAQAVDAVEHVLSEARWGGTNIEGALLESFDTVRAAKQRGDDLAHAQIVLITDGEADVDEAKVTQAREQVGDVPVGVSIIALGEENPTLRKLAERQRERGERVFYQFVPDDLIRDLVEGNEVMLPLHLPDTRSAEAIGQDVHALVREIELLQRKRDDDAIAGVSDEVAALDEVGLSFEDLPQSEQARILALNRDAETLLRRFERWFPKLDVSAQRDVLLAASTDDGAALAELDALIGAVADTTELAGGMGLRRLSDAVELLERLLHDAGISFTRYELLLGRYPAELAPAIDAVRGAAGLSPTG